MQLSRTKFRKSFILSTKKWIKCFPGKNSVNSREKSGDITAGYRARRPAESEEAAAVAGARAGAAAPHAVTADPTQAEGCGGGGRGGLGQRGRCRAHRSSSVGVRACAANSHPPFMHIGRDPARKAQSPLSFPASFPLPCAEVPCLAGSPRRHLLVSPELAVRAPHPQPALGERKAPRPRAERTILRGRAAARPGLDRRARGELTRTSALDAGGGPSGPHRTRSGSGLLPEAVEGRNGCPAAGRLVTAPESARGA